MAAAARAQGVAGGPAAGAYAGAPGGGPRCEWDVGRGCQGVCERAHAGVRGWEGGLGASGMSAYMHGVLYGVLWEMAAGHVSESRERLYSLEVTPTPALVSRLQTSVGNVMGVGLGPNRSLDSPSGSGSERPSLPNPARMMFGRSNPGRKPHGSSQKV